MTTYAVIASSTDHSYDFFAPLTALMWKRVIGFETIAFLINTADEWQKPYSQVVKQKLFEAGAKIHHIGRIDGYLEAQAAQSSRQHAAALDLPETDTLVSGDVDMWPLQKHWFLQHDPDKYDLTLHYANAYGPVIPPSQPPYFCTCYMVATVKVWREIVGLENRGEIKSQLQANMDRTLNRRHDSWLGWNHDELFMGSRIKGWDGYPSRCQFINRYGGPPDDRIDRACWPNELEKGGFNWNRNWVDTHLLRPGAVAPNWAKIRPILAHFVPDRMDWVDSYVKEYRHARYE